MRVIRIARSGYLSALLSGTPGNAGNLARGVANHGANRRLPVAMAVAAPDLQAGAYNVRDV